MKARRRFILERTPIEGAPRLVPGDQEHALKVLRSKPGDLLLGIDGRGSAWELEVTLADRRRLELRPTGPPQFSPAPGQAGASLPWIEVWCPLPKGGRAETMLGRLTQLGLARLVPLVSERTEVQARGASAGRMEKLERTAREALKQCGRLWLPEIGPGRGLEELERAASRRILLDPAGAARLSAELGERSPEPKWTREHPLILIAGPEGGFTPRERGALTESGVGLARLSPHVLRIETAVEAAVAVVAEHTWTPRE